MKSTQQTGGLRAETSSERLRLTPRVCLDLLAVATALSPSLAVRQNKLLENQSFWRLRNI